MKVWSFIVAFFCLAQTAYALDLPQMQRMALDNRKIVQRYMVNLEKSEKERVKAGGGYLPSVDVSYTTNSLKKPNPLAGQLGRENSVVYGAVSLNLFAGFRDKYNIESADLLQQVEARRLQGIRQDIQLNVALRYLDVYQRQANLLVAEDAYTTLKKLYADGENRLEVGLIDTNELLKIKVDLDNADITVKRAEADRESGERCPTAWE